MPEVRKAIALSAAHGELGLRKRWQMGRSLRAQGYGQAIVLPRSLKAAVPTLAARIPRRTEYRGEWRYGLLNDSRRRLGQCSAITFLKTSLCVGATRGVPGMFIQRGPR